MSACVTLLLSLWFGARPLQEEPSSPPAAPAKPSVQEAVRKLEAASSEADASAALEALLADHLDADELAGAARFVARRRVSADGEKFLRAVAERSASEVARGFATWSLAQLLLVVQETPALLAGRDAAAVGKEAEALLQKVVDDYYLLDWRTTGYLGADAQAQLFELQHLQIGMVAPEIEGADEDGVPFKLSDYRGKVVGLDFWGFWCPICVANLPHERELVQRLKDAPFSLVGVNSDPKERLAEAASYDRIAWRSFFDGGDAYGPIARRWNVRSWPTIYVLDEKGVIRARTEDAEEMARKVDELLVAMQGAMQEKPKPVAPPPQAGPAPATSLSSPPSASKEKVDALKKEFDDAKRASPEKFIPRFRELAAQLKGEPAALDCHVWILRWSRSPADKETAYAALLADHAESPQIVDAVRTIGRYGSADAAERFLRAILEKSPHRDVKGYATYSLASLLLGQEKPREAEELLVKVAAEFKELEHRRGSLGAAAEADLFELRSLQIGKVAPEIEGEDVDGVKFKLSDYRGKVVVIDFWGFW